MLRLLAVAVVASAHVAQPRQFLLTLAKDIHGRVPPQLVLVDASGHLIRKIGTSGYVLVRGEWSPNRQSIAWSDPQGVHVEDADGTNQRLLVAHVPGCNTLCTQPWFIWTPDGTALDVGGVGKQTNELLLVPIDGAPPSALVPAKPWENPVPIMWTPGGRSFVWAGGVSHVGSHGCCFDAIYETTAATHVTTTVFRTNQTQGQGVDLAPDASRWIEFSDARNLKDGYDLVLVDAHGTKRILYSGTTAGAAWSPDGRTIATVATGNRVVTITVATGRVHDIGRGEQLFYGRDGTLYITRDTYSDVWTSRGNGPERFLFRTPGRLEIYSLDAD